MIELHGWLSVSETFRDEDLFSQEELDSIILKVKEIIFNSNCGIDLQYMNGIPYINTAFFPNHRTKEVDNIIEIYQNISKIATGSFGIIYLRDDEDKLYYNQFQVYVFKKGNCTFKIDTDFSPCIPTIENDTDTPKGDYKNGI
ncbi:MAG TPA: hypothetical protein DCO72_07170 [Ruminococcus sp.]|nr:hypothetical protein [Ruminococcus sp.]